MKNYQQVRNEQKQASIQLVAATEAELFGLLNQKFEETARATFDVIINDHIKFNQKAISQFFYDGKVVMHPHVEAEYEWLKKFRLPDGGIDFSAFKNSKDCEELSDKKEFVDFDSLVTQVFHVLHEEGLMPLHKLVSETQRGYGYVPSRKKGLGVKTSVLGDPDSSSKNVIQQLTQQLEAKQST